MNKTETVITLKHVQAALGGLKDQQFTASNFNIMHHVRIIRELTDYMLCKAQDAQPSQVKQKLSLHQQRAKVSFKRFLYFFGLKSVNVIL